MGRLQHIGLDVDGVLRDMASQLVHVFEREHPELKGRHLPIEEWPDWWDFARYFPAEADIYTLTRRFQRDIWEGSSPYPGVDAFLQRLCRERTVHIVTSQPTPASAELTRAWLQRHQVPVPPERIHITSSKQDAPVQLLVDDMAHNLEAVQLAGIVGVCVDRPWNRAWEGFRIHSLDELFGLLEVLERS